MDLVKEDCNELEIFDLLQIVWCFDEEIKANMIVFGKKNYLYCCEKHLSKK